MLNDRQRKRFARQVLLPEIGMAGQGALCRASVRLASPAGATPDAAAEAVARAYLERAGVTVQGPSARAQRQQPEPQPGQAQQPGPEAHTEAAPLVALPSAGELDATATDPGLRHAAAALHGALAAVEGIKAIVGAGRAATFDHVTLTGAPQTAAKDAR